jgi:hypothetical protein
MPSSLMVFSPKSVLPEVELPGLQPKVKDFRLIVHRQNRLPVLHRTIPQDFGGIVSEGTLFAIFWLLTLWFV